MDDEGDKAAVDCGGEDCGGCVLVFVWCFNELIAPSSSPFVAADEGLLSPPSSALT